MSDKDLEALKKELAKDDEKDALKEVQNDADDQDDYDADDQDDVPDGDYDAEDEDQDEGSNKEPEEDKDKDEETGKKGSEDEEKEAERQRRRDKRKRSKEWRKQKERELRLKLDQERAEKEELSQRLARLEERHVSTDFQRLESEINKGLRAIETAKAAMAKAEEEKDPMTWAKANQLHRDAQDYVRTRSDLKGHMVEQLKQRQQGGAMTTTPQIKSYATTFMRKNADWFDQQNQSLKRAVLEIDSEVMSEGFNPNTAAYWKELEARCRDVFNRPRKAKQKSMVGSSSSGGSMRDVSHGLDATYVKMLKDQGIWDDPKMRKSAIENYKREKAKSKA